MSLRARGLAALLAFAVLAAGCSAPADAADATDGDGGGALPGELRGVAIDPAVRPVEGVTVAIPARPDVAAATTDADGLFVLAGVLPGTVILSATKAGYLEAFAQVQVGAESTPVVQVRMEPLAETTPYYVLESFEGFMDCGVGSAPLFGMTAGCLVLVGAGLYAACVGADPVPPTGVCLDTANPYYTSAALGDMAMAQTEAVWTPTVSGQSELLIGSYVVDADGAVVGGLPTAAGQSVLVRRINATVADEFDLGGANRAAIFINPGNSAAANVVLQQGYQVFHTSTFYFELPEAWVFAVDGPPQVPEQCTVCLVGG